MKPFVFFSFCLWAGTSSLAQTAVDTTLYIQNVEVSGRRMAGLSVGEWNRLQVTHNLSVLTGTTAEAFRQMPSVITDIEGGITFRGSSKAALLLNGVPYGMLEEHSGDLLIQLPALFFDHLSATSYPSITMVPDGDAGLLNLTSTLLTADNSPLQFTVGAGLQERYNAGVVVNLHPGRFHVIGKYNYRREFRERSFRKSTVTPKNRTEMNNSACARPDVHVADLRVGYDVTHNDLLTVYGLYSLMDYDRYGRIHNRVFNPAGEQKKYVIRNRYNDQRQEAYAAELAWKHRFSHPGEQIDFRFNYNNFVYDEDNDFKNEHPKSGAIVAEDNLQVNREKHNYYWSAAYQRALHDGWFLQGGYMGRYKEESYHTDAQNKTEQGWQPNSQKTYAYDFNRSLHLIYASAQKQWSQFTAEVGLQGEFSRQKVEEVKESNFHLYPRIRFAYQWGQHSHLSLSYQQRAVRPTGSFLNPYVDYSDATHLLVGNPSLQDEQIHLTELNYQFGISAFRFSTGIFYRNRQNRMMEVATQQDNNTFWKQENVGDSQTFGWDLSVSWSPIRLLAVGLSGELYRDEIEGRTVGYGPKKSMVCGDVKGNVNLYLTSTTELQMDAFYISDQLTPQGKIKDHYSVNVGISQYFMNRKLRANLSVNNLFDSLGETTVIDTEALQMVQVRDRDARVTWLTLTYSL